MEKITHKKKYRKEVIEYFKNNSGELIEIEYSKDISDSNVSEQLSKQGITTTARQARLKTLLKAGITLKILEVHNALCGLIAQNAKRNHY